MAQARQTPPNTNIAAIDIAPPGTPDNVGVFAFRAGDEIPPAWLEQNGDYVKSLEEALGGSNKVVRRAPLSDAPTIAAGARGAGGSEP